MHSISHAFSPTVVRFATASANFETIETGTVIADKEIVPIEVEE